MFGWFRRLLRWPLPPDREVERLIEVNRARPRDGMAATDWEKVNRAGARRWGEVEQGQRRLRKTDS